jgi:hypothetical protein
MQDRARCAMALEPLVASVEVGLQWNRSNALTRCFEAHAKVGICNLCATNPAHSTQHILRTAHTVPRTHSTQHALLGAHAKVTRACFLSSQA